MSASRPNRRCVFCREVESLRDAVAIFSTAEGLKFCAHARCQAARARAGLTDSRDGAA